MDLTILKKKISSYRTPKGRITSLPDELLGEILNSWEQWTGPASGFYRSLGVDQRKMASLMGRAKRLKREGAFDGVDFAEVQVTDEGVSSASLVGGINGVEIVWLGKHIIRFSRVDDLIQFLDRVDKTKSQTVEVEELEEAA